MSKKRKIILSETRQVFMVQQLRSWLEELPADAQLREIRTFDGDTTVTWMELRPL